MSYTNVSPTISMRKLSENTWHTFQCEIFHVETRPSRKCGKVHYTLTHNHPHLVSNWHQLCSSNICMLMRVLNCNLLIGQLRTSYPSCRDCRAIKWNDLFAISQSFQQCVHTLICKFQSVSFTPNDYPKISRLTRTNGDITLSTLSTFDYVKPIEPLSSRTHKFPFIDKTMNSNH